MKKNIISRKTAYVLHQLMNERRANLGLLIELLVVSIIVWRGIDTEYVRFATAMEPMGFDITNCYRVGISQLSPNVPGYDATHADSASIVNDQLALLDRLRHDEDIEYACYTWGADPYNGQNEGNTVTFGGSPANYSIKYVQPDYLKLFRIQSLDGDKTPDELAALLHDRQILLAPTRDVSADTLRRYLGKEVKSRLYWGDSIYRVAALVQPVKRFTWEPSYEATRTCITSFEVNNLYDGGDFIKLSIRVKEIRAEGFADRFREKIKDQRLREGNFYVNGITSYEQLRYYSESQMRWTNHLTVALLSFFLVNVFLGLLGTFWFRTQRRFPEIGLQKAIGATNRDIALRLFSEAALLMTIAFLLSLLINVAIGYSDIGATYNGKALEPGRFALVTVLSYVLMLAVIAIGIWFPARRAARTNPVEVLKGE